MKRSIILIVICTVALPVAAENPAIVKLTAEPETVTVGDQFALDVTIDSDEVINLADIILEYEPDLLRLIGADCTGSRFTFEALTRLDHARGQLRVVRGQPHASAPSGKDLAYCTLTFRVIGAAGSARVAVVMPTPGMPDGSRVYKDDGIPSDVFGICP